jgi:hypothetical protein
MNEGKKFLGPPKHVFDLGHQRRVAKKVDALLNGKIVDAAGKVIGDILYSDGNTVFKISASSGTLNLRGEYDPDADYKLHDMVVISTGLSQGTFVALQDVSGIAPTTGAPNWMQLPGGLLGQWF